jgi:hypothetical protein
MLANKCSITREMGLSCPASGDYRGGVTNETKAASDPGSATVSTSTRYRCSSCGNLTRFNVVTTRRTKAFHHYSVGGELTIEEVEVLDEAVEEVSCRWCGNGNSIEVVDHESAVPATK